MNASMFFMMDGITLIPKNGAKKSYSYQAEVPMLSIPMRGMGLWFPIMRKRRLLCASMVGTIDGITFILKNAKKKSFSYQAKASMSPIPRRRMCLGSPIMKKRRSLHASSFDTIDGISWIQKNVERKAFLI